MQELPDLPLFYADEIDGYRTSVHGFVPDKNDYDPLFKGVYLS